MNTSFTEELKRTLHDFACSSSDDELRRAFDEAEYDFFSQVEEPECYVMRDLSLGDVALQPGFGRNCDDGGLRMTISRRFVLEVDDLSDLQGAGIAAADHEDLALAA